MQLPRFPQVAGGNVDVTVNHLGPCGPKQLPIEGRASGKKGLGA